MNVRHNHKANEDGQISQSLSNKDRVLTSTAYHNNFFYNRLLLCKGKDLLNFSKNIFSYLVNSTTIKDWISMPPRSRYGALHACMQARGRRRGGSNRLFHLKFYEPLPFKPT